MRFPGDYLELVSKVLAGGVVVFVFEYENACRSTITPALEYILLIRFKTSRKTVNERHRLETVFILLFPLNRRETEGVKKKCTLLHVRHFFQISLTNKT